jgi:hypothetical protein
MRHPAALEQTDDEDQHDCTHTATRMLSRLIPFTTFGSLKSSPANHPLISPPAMPTNKDVAQQAEALALHHLSAQPTRDVSNNDPRK